jgi:hypothetical protein
MKKFICVTILSFLLFSCGSDGDDKKTSANSSGDKKETGKTGESEKESVWLSGLKIKKERLKAEKCLDVQREEWMDEEPEPFCASTTVDLLKISLNEEDVAEKINAQIASAITGKRNDTNIKAYVNKVKSLKNVEEAVEEDYACSLIDSTDRLLVVGVNFSYMAYMAAHPGASMTVFNFDLESGSTIGLREVLVEDHLKPLKGIVYKKFVKKNGKDGWDFTNVNNFKLSKNIVIKRKGLEFMYNSYEIGSYAAGAPNVLITWEELKDLRKENPYVKFD